MNNIFTYNGLNIQPHTKKQYTNICFLTDSNRENLCIFMLTPGGFTDAYEVAKQIWYKRVFIFTPSLDSLFISDILRLLTSLKRIKSTCNIFFPLRSESIITNSDFENNLIIAHNINLLEENSSMIIDYLPSREKSEYFDIGISYGNEKILLCSYLDYDKAFKLYSNDSFNEIHIPYIQNTYGGIAYRDLFLLEEFKPIRDKFICNGFANEFEYEECKNNKFSKIGEVKRYDFI